MNWSVSTLLLLHLTIRPPEPMFSLLWNLFASPWLTRIEFPPHPKHHEQPLGVLNNVGFNEFYHYNYLRKIPNSMFFFGGVGGKHVETHGQFLGPFQGMTWLTPGSPQRVVESSWGAMEEPCFWFWKLQFNYTWIFQVKNLPKTDSLHI